MRIAMVSSWPRSGKPVCEYGYHLVRSLSLCDEVEEIVVLADTFNGESETIASKKVKIIRCWDYDSLFILPKLVRKIREIKPALCWFNVTLGNFGTSITNLPALSTPLALQILGIPTLVTLHNIVDMTKMDEIGKTTLS